MRLYRGEEDRGEGGGGLGRRRGGETRKKRFRLEGKSTGIESDALADERDMGQFDVGLGS